MARYRFKAKLVPTVVTLVLLPILAGLGFWQLDRAEQKRVIQHDYEERGQLSPVLLADERLDAGRFDFRRAFARGVFEPMYQILLDNRVHQGQAGYHVLTPLRVEGAELRVLVNRGWISWGKDRQQVPIVDVPVRPVTITGRLRRPPEAYFTLEDESKLTNFRRIWQNLNLQRYQQTVGFSVQPLVLELDPADIEAGGFIRQWPEYSDGWIDRHRGYAFQWFALAAALVLIYVLVNIHRRDETQEELKL